MRELIVWVIGITAINLGIYLYMLQLVNNYGKVGSVLFFIAILITFIISVVFASTSEEYARSKFFIISIFAFASIILTSIIIFISATSLGTIALINFFTAIIIVLAANKANDDYEESILKIFILTIVDFALILAIVYNNLPKG